MAAKGNRIAIRLRYVWSRIGKLDLGSVVERARESAHQHHKATPVVLVDMLWSAAFRNTAFQDYVDWDFPILTRAERETYMTHSLSNHIAMAHDDPAYRGVFQDKIEFNRVFDEFLHREWLDIRETDVDGVRDFVTRHGRVMGKVPFSNSGHGVERHEAADVTDWDAFVASLHEKGQTLLEELIVQHEVLAEICPGTVNTTRVTTFFDGTTTHVLAMAQKFGRGQASDQQTFGGFYTMLDMEGRSKGPGYDSHANVHLAHPESGVSIPDFRLPLVDELMAFIDRVARVVPQVRYVGWDVVITPTGPVLVEGNWAAGVYENKPSVTGIRTGNRAVYEAAVGGI